MGDWNSGSDTSMFLPYFGSLPGNAEAEDIVWS